MFIYQEIHIDLATNSVFFFFFPFPAIFFFLFRFARMAYFGSRVKKQIENEDNEAWKKVMEFYQKEFLCDIKLTVGHESRSAHRIVLSSLCPKGPWSKQGAATASHSDNGPFQLDVSDVFKTPETFANVIDFIYLGTIKLKTDTVLQILEVAIQLNLIDLIIHCSQFLLEHIRINNVLSLWNLAYEMELRQLAEVCRVLARELFRDVILESNDMKMLSASFMDMLVGQKYVTNTVTSIEIAGFILKWLIEDPEGRRESARVLISKIGICRTDLYQIGDSVCQNHEIKSETLQEMLRDCCISRSRETLSSEAPLATAVHLNSAFEEPLSLDREPLPQPPARRLPDGDGGWMLMVRDDKSTTVFCQKSKTWLEFPNITYPYIVGLSDRKYLACTKQQFARSFEIMDFTRFQQPRSIEERRLMDDAFPEPEYIWYLCNKKKWYLASLISTPDKYSLVLHEWDDMNGVFVFRHNFKTSLSNQWIIKGFTYFNDNNCSLILIISSLANVDYQSAKPYDIFYLFRVSWKREAFIEEVIKDMFYYRCSSMTKEDFLYLNDCLYLFDQGLVKNLVYAIEYNVPVTIPAIAFDLRSGNNSTYKSIQLSQPGLNILPLKRKSLQPQQASISQPTLSSNATTSSLASDYAKNRGLSSENQSCVSVIGDKLFLVTHRAPGIVHVFKIDIFQNSWELTPPLPLAALTDIKVNSFYSDCSLHDGFPMGRKRFESEDFPIFENWCLQQWQGIGEAIANDSNRPILSN